MAQAAKIMGVDYFEQVEYKFAKNSVQIYNCTLVLSTTKTPIDDRVSFIAGTTNYD